MASGFSVGQLASCCGLFTQLLDGGDGVAPTAPSAAYCPAPAQVSFCVLTCVPSELCGGHARSLTWGVKSEHWVWSRTGRMMLLQNFAYFCTTSGPEGEIC